jgi:hypothetical protein
VARPTVTPAAAAGLGRPPRRPVALVQASHVDRALVVVLVVLAGGAASAARPALAASDRGRRQR